MMSEHKAEIIVGVTVTLAVIILVGGIIWGKRAEFFPNRSFITVNFDDVQGLTRGDPVFIRGVKQGEIDDIILKQDHIQVRLWIRGDIPLHTDVQFTIEMEEFLGGKKLTIDPGTSGQYADLNNIYTGESHGDAVSMFKKADAILTRADETLQKINHFLETDRLNRVLQSVEATTHEALTMLRENRQSLKSTIHRLEKIARTFEEDSTLIRTGMVMARLDTTVQIIQQLTHRIETEEGTLGKLLSDRNLFDQLLRTSQDLDSLITDIKANPKKYIHFSIF
jgi:phospholipid/cholesterol/gamma-HCH transport system substrate-binding protein